jgi:hypothetical protein
LRVARVTLGLLLLGVPAAGVDVGPPPIPHETEEDAVAGEAKPLPPEVPRPAFMEAKPYLPEWLLRNKREGRYVTAVPAIGFGSEEGFNIGVLAEFFDNGSRDDPFFRSTPYRQNVSVIATVSLAGVQTYLARLDQPYIRGSPYRLRVAGGYLRSDIANYFGVGNDSMRALSFPGLPGVSFEKFDDYENAISRAVAGTTYANYNHYRLRQGFLFGAVERDLAGGLVRPLLGLQFSRVSIGDYTGETVDATDAAGSTVDAIEAPTKLFEDCTAGLLNGCEGGWDNFVKLGLTFDTRDFEPDPNQGLIAQLTAELATRALGSSFDYQRVTASVAGFATPFPEHARLVLAGRALYSMQFGDVPFFSIDTFAFNTRDRFGLGGFDTLRGYRRDRFIGAAGALVNAELRWSVGEWDVWGQHLKPMLVPLVETGRVFDDIGATTLQGWRFGYGLGFRLAWNLATIVSVDVGRSTEDQLLYVEIGHQF